MLSQFQSRGLRGGMMEVTSPKLDPTRHSVPWDTGVLWITAAPAPVGDKSTGILPYQIDPFHRNFLFQSGRITRVHWKLRLDYMTSRRSVPISTPKVAREKPRAGTTRGETTRHNIFRFLLPSRSKIGVSQGISASSAVFNCYIFWNLIWKWAIQVIATESAAKESFLFGEFDSFNSF
jgi:hypothetical protein